MRWYTKTAVLHLNLQDRYVTISGDQWFDTFNVKDQLKSVGFRWNGEAWFQDVSAFQANTRAQELLRGLGLPVESVVKTTVQTTPQPQKPLRGISANWVLAENLSDPNSPPGTLYALKRNPQGGWDFVNENGQNGTFSDQQVRSMVKSIKGEDGKAIQGPDPSQLFSTQKPDTEPPTASEQTPAGRIPEDRISPYQEAIQNTFTESEQNIMMNALAGTGKTTMLRHLSSFKDPNEKWLYLVFNKKNQIEASTGKGAFPGGVEVLTSHSFLGKVLNTSSDKGTIDRTELWQQKGERLPRLLDDIMEHDDTFPRQFLYSAKKVIKQLASLSKANAIDPRDANAGSQVQSIVDSYQIDMDISTERQRTDRDWSPQLIEKTLEVLHYSLPGQARNEFRGARDHDDTLWYAATLDGVQWPHYDVVLADEVQDFNKCQSIMLQKLAEAGARIVAVGDKNQAIYRFRGADADAFDNVQSIVMQQNRGGAPHELPVNYRSGKNIIEYVRENTHVKDLRAGKAIEGEVTEGVNYDTAVDNLAQEWSKNQGKLNDQTAMIARTNRPLVDAALDLLRNGIDFQIIGRDFSRELIQVIEKLTGRGRRANHFGITEFPGRMQNYIGDLEERWRGKISKTDELSELRNVAESLNNVISYLESMDYRDPKIRRGAQIEDTRDFIDYLREKFSGINTDTPQGANEYAKMDPKSFVTLTTAHRSKGLEFNRTFIVAPELFPHPRARSPEELAQENNAWYVALTRAMNELHVLAPMPQERRAQAWIWHNCAFSAKGP